MAVEDKELFIQTVKDVMLPIAYIIGYIALTVVLSMLWPPMLAVMLVLGVGLVISFFVYEDRLADKKREEERRKRGY